MKKVTNKGGKKNRRNEKKKGKTKQRKGIESGRQRTMQQIENSRARARQEKTKEKTKEKDRFSKSFPSLIRAIDISKSYSKLDLDWESSEELLEVLFSEIKGGLGKLKNAENDVLWLWKQNDKEVNQFLNQFEA